MDLTSPSFTWDGRLLVAHMISLLASSVTLMHPSAITFSFHKRCFRDGRAIPTFALPGLVCGTLHIAQQEAQTIEAVKIALKGL